MKLENLLKSSICEINFHGLIVNYDHRAEVFWWKEGSDVIHKFWANIELSKPVIFSCKKGKLNLNPET
tara:strand:- start:58 stop:261 length:204 start_codon:yes stop_codon:yes gene_type:complete